MPRPNTRQFSLRIERQFDVPAKRVWQAWTGRAEMARWFGEGPDRARVHELDPRRGGRLRITFGRGSPGALAGNYFGVFLSVRPAKALALVVIEAPSRWFETVRVRFRHSRGSTRMIFESSIAVIRARRNAPGLLSAAFDRLADATAES